MDRAVDRSNTDESFASVSEASKSKKKPTALERKPSKLQRLASKLRKSKKDKSATGDGSKSSSRGGSGNVENKTDTQLLSSQSSHRRGAAMPEGSYGSGGGLLSARPQGLQDFTGTTASKIKMFEEGAFNLDTDIGSLTEKGLDNLRGDLAQLDGEVLENLKKAVQQQYDVFIRATPGILQLEGDVVALRNLLHSMSQLTQSLNTISAAVAQTQKRWASDSLAPSALEDAESAWRESGDGVKWADYLDDCDMAIAERRLPEALSLVRKLETMAQRARGAAGDGGGGGNVTQARARRLSEEAEARRQALMSLAEQPILQPTATSADVRGAAALLAEIAGRQHAQRVLLEACSARLRRQQEALLKPANSGGADADGCDYAAALGQKLVLCLGQAADDVAAVFGGSGEGDAGALEGGADLAAAFLVWALQEAGSACHLLRKHALSPFAAPAGLPATCRCLRVFLSYGAALENSHSLRLVATLLRETWSVVEQVLLKRIRKTGEALRRSAYTEVDQLADGACSLPQTAEDLDDWESLSAVFPSANFLLDELDSISADMVLVQSPRAAAAVRRGVGELFQGYTATLAGALNRRLKYAEAEEVQDRLAQGVEVAMETATALVERLMPDATAQLSELYGDMCDAQLLGEHLMRMGESLGMTTVPLTPGGGHIATAEEESDIDYLEEDGQDEEAVGDVHDKGGADVAPVTEGADLAAPRGSARLAPPPMVAAGKAELVGEESSEQYVQYRTTSDE